MSKVLNSILSSDLSIEEKQEIFDTSRLEGSDRKVCESALGLMLENAQLRQAVSDVSKIQAKFKEELDKFLCPPWFPAHFVKIIATQKGDRALVMQNNQPRVVELAPDVEKKELEPGDTVILNESQNVILERNIDSGTRGGTMARFDRWTEDGRAIVRFREEEIVCGAGPLVDTLKKSKKKIKAGDLVRWDENLKLAFERFESEEGKEFILQDVPQIGREAVGGQDENLNKVLDFLTMAVVSPDKAKAYGISGKGSMLMIGPPGTGKTLMAKVSAYELSKIAKKKVRFGVVKPGEWTSPWVGVTEQKIRSTFASLKQATEDGGYAVLFMDEIEGIGRIRGNATNQHADKFLTALLAELDGFADRKNIAIVAATNRKDLIDPALLERLSEVEVVVGRPNREGAKKIFGIHLPTSIPFHANGVSAEQAREDSIEKAVEILYDGDPLCVVTLEDGRQRDVLANELVSGRMIEQACKMARRTAFLRDVRESKAGMIVEDVRSAVADAVVRLSTTLSAQNVKSYITDIPSEARVVDVTTSKRNR